MRARRSVSRSRRLRAGRPLRQLRIHLLCKQRQLTGVTRHVSDTELEGLIKPGEPVSYSRFITGIFDLYGNAQGKTLVGDKDPGYVRKLATLHDL